MVFWNFVPTPNVVDLAKDIGDGGDFTMGMENYADRMEKSWNYVKNGDIGGLLGAEVDEAFMAVPDWAAVEAGKAIDPYEEMQMPKKWDKMPYDHIKYTKGLLDLKKQQDQAVFIHFIGTGGRQAEYFAQSFPEDYIAGVKDIYEHLINKKGQWFEIADFKSKSELDARAAEIFQAHLDEQKEVGLYYRNVILWQIKQDFLRILKEMNEEARKEHENQYASESKLFFKSFQKAYGWIRENFPEVADQIDSYQESFDQAMKALHEFQKWIDDEDIPVLDEIRDFYDWHLENTRGVAGAIPGMDELAKSMFGKDLSEMNYLEMADAGAQLANPAYGLARSAMELNETMRKSLEAKAELTEEEFIALMQHYMIVELDSYEFMPNGDVKYPIEDLDDWVTDETIPEEPMALMRPLPTASKPKETRPLPTTSRDSMFEQTYVPDVGHDDVNPGLVPGEKPCAPVLAPTGPGLTIDDIVPPAVDHFGPIKRQSQLFLDQGGRRDRQYMRGEIGSIGTIW
jgi:hypothetical protein